MFFYCNVCSLLKQSFIILGIFIVFVYSIFFHSHSESCVWYLGVARASHRAIPGIRVKSQIISY